MPRLPHKVPRRHRRPNPAQARHQSQPSALSATPATQNESRCHEVPCLLRETKADVTKCPACLPGKVPRRHRRPKPVQARHQSQPNALSATSATQNESRCHEVPCLLRETKADVTKCHACLPGKVPRRHRRPKPVQARHQSQPNALSATSATQNESRCHEVPCLLRETKADVTKCHACLPGKVPRRHRRPKPVQARHQSQPNALSATSATQNESRCHEEPCLPREKKADVTKCHAWDVKRSWMSPNATPAEGRCHQVLRLPRETEVDVTKRHACHVKRR